MSTRGGLWRTPPYWLAIISLTSSPLMASEPDRASREPVLIVTSSSAPAYQAALAGLMERMPKVPVVELAGRTQNAELRRLIDERKPRVIVALGSLAGEAVAQSGIPAILAMVLEPDSGGRAAAPVATVSLAVPLVSMLAELRRLSPGATRVGVIRLASVASPSRSDLAAQGKRYGFTLEIVECSGPEQLLERFVALKNRVDFVWCEPESSLLNQTTAQPLLVASVRNRIPIIGFSEGLVKAGATLGIYPDFRDIGLQTADLVRKYLASEPVSGRYAPRTVKIAVNQRVIRLLGIEGLARIDSGDSQIVVFR